LNSKKKKNLFFFPRVVERFALSCAGFCVATYILGVFIYLFIYFVSKNKKRKFE